MVSFYGDYDLTETVNIPFNTFSSDDPSASVTVTNLANGDVYVHQDGVEGTPTGITVSLNVGTVNGNHLAILDLSDTNDVGFYAVGSRYQVRMEGVTIDGAQVNAWIGAFSIGCTLRPATAGRTLVVESDGVAHADLKEWLGVAPLALSSQQVQVAEVLLADGAHGGSSTVLTLSQLVISGSHANGTIDIDNSGGAGVKIDSFVTDGVVIGAGGGGDGIVATGHGAGAGFYIVGGASGQGLLIAEGLFIDTVEVTGTTTLTGAVTMPAGLTGNITGTVSGNSTHDAAAVLSALGTGSWITGAVWNADWDAEVQSEVDDALVAYNAAKRTDMMRGG